MVLMDYKILFVDLVVSYYDRHSIYYITSVLDRLGITSHYIQSRNISEISKAIKDNNINVIMYSSFTNMLLNYSHLDQEIKKLHPKIFSIIGGPGLTQRKDRELLVQNNSQINAICIGEGEKAITNFFSSDLSFKKNIIKPYQLDPIIRLNDVLLE